MCGLCECMMCIVDCSYFCVILTCLLGECQMSVCCGFRISLCDVILCALYSAEFWVMSQMLV